MSLVPALDASDEAAWLVQASTVLSGQVFCLPGIQPGWLVR